MRFMATRSSRRWLKLPRCCESGGRLDSAGCARGHPVINRCAVTAAGLLDDKLEIRHVLTSVWICGYVGLGLDGAIANIGSVNVVRVWLEMPAIPSSGKAIRCREPHIAAQQHSRLGFDGTNGGERLGACKGPVVRTVCSQRFSTLQNARSLYRNGTRLVRALRQRLHPRLPSCRVVFRRS